MSNLIKINNFNNLIGQEKLKLTLMTMVNAVLIINAVEKTKVQLDHILFTGPAGVGKTTFAEQIADFLKANIKLTQGPLLKTKVDVITLFGGIKAHDIIFIDEIHSINKNIQELFYGAMDKQTLDLILGTNDNYKIIRLKLPPFTLIGATTKSTNLSMPFRSRFGFVAEFSPYQINEIAQIIELNAQLKGWKIDNKASMIIAQHSRNNPRIAKNLLKRVIDICVVKNLSTINDESIKQTLKNLNIYQFGLSQNHINYLKALQIDFNYNWVSLELIVNTLLMSKQYAESEIEPPLLQNNLIIKSTRGRKLTNYGKNYLLKI